MKQLSAREATGAGKALTAPIATLRSEIFTALEEVDAAGPAQGIKDDKFGLGLQKALRISWPDTPAVDAQLKSAQGQRLAVAVLVVFGSLPVAILLGGLGLGVVFAQLGVLLGLMLLPAVLLGALFPGRGHQLAYEWGKRMLSFLVRKFLYALVLVVLLAVEFALAGSAAATGFGWLFSYLLQVCFFWLVLLKRHALIGRFNEAITAHRPERGTVRDELAEVYLGSRLAQMGYAQARRPMRATGRLAGLSRDRIKRSQKAAIGHDRLGGHGEDPGDPGRPGGPVSPTNGPRGAPELPRRPRGGDDPAQGPRRSPRRSAIVRKNKRKPPASLGRSQPPGETPTPDSAPGPEQRPADEQAPAQPLSAPAGSAIRTSEAGARATPSRRPEAGKLATPGTSSRPEPGASAHSGQTGPQEHAPPPSTTARQDGLPERQSPAGDDRPPAPSRPREPPAAGRPPRDQDRRRRARW